jgi:hypothetical protein
MIAGCGGCAFIGVPILAAILFPVFAQAREKARQASCASNLKQQGLAILMYTQDYDNRLPPAARWMDVTDPYVGSSAAAVRQCPSVSGGGSAANSGVFGYAFDSRLSGRTQSKIASSGQVTMAYDSDDLGRNANDPGTSLAGGKGRHGSRSRPGNNHLFADGSVRWMPLAASRSGP